MARTHTQPKTKGGGTYRSNKLYRISTKPIVRFDMPEKERVKRVDRTWARQMITGKVKDGKHTIPVGPYVRIAGQRHLDDLQRAQDDSSFPYRFSARRGYSVVWWIEHYCFLSKGKFEGKPFKMNWWQQWITAVMFGWVYRRKHEGAEKGERRFRKAYLETGKGSGKTPWEAAIAFYMLSSDGEKRGEGFVIGKNAEQADVTFGFLKAMASYSPELDMWCKPKGGTAPFLFAHDDSRSWLRKTASDSAGKGKSGPMPNFVLADEYHEHLTAATLDFYESGTKARTSPLTLIGTNSGSDLNSACGVEHVYAVEVLEKKEENENYFVFICSLDEDDDPFENPEVWGKTNPSMPIIPGERYLRDQIRKATGLPSKRSLVERLQFCIWTEAEDPWIDRAAWVRCETKESLPDDIYERPSFLALDLSKTTDLAALTIVTDMDDYFLAQHWAWTPGATLEEREKRDKAPYAGWVKNSFLRTCPGKVIEYEYICLQIQELLDIYNIEAMCYDSWRIDQLISAAKTVRLELTKDPHREGLLIMPHAQGFERERKKDHPEEKPDEVISLWMPKSIEDCERLILTEKLQSVYNPLVRSAVLGAVVVADGSENRKFSKLKANRRIDPCLSLTMAVGLASSRRPEPFDVGSFVPMSLETPILGRLEA